MTEAHIKNGGYDLEGVIYHQHSNRLMIEIMKLFPKEIPVIDLGCGHNFYVGVLKYAGYNAVGTDMVDLGSKHFFKSDITKPIFDTLLRNVISLEVGEHIPSELSVGYLNNLTYFKGDVIMSWAIPGQAGIGHINCKSNELVIAEMKKRNYEIDLEKTNQLRKSVNGCHCGWFMNTLMYFSPCK